MRGKLLIASATTFVVSLFVVVGLPASTSALDVPAEPETTVVTPPADTTTTTVTEPTPTVSGLAQQEPTEQPVTPDLLEAADPPVIPPPAPGTPTTPSPSTNQDIVWNWTPPAGYVPYDPSPDDGTNEGVILVPAPTEEAPNPTPPPIETPDDITGYGYELFDADNASKAKGEVAANVTTVTTPVTNIGKYIFQVWTLNRMGTQSEKAEGQTMIVPVTSETPGRGGAPIDNPYVEARQYVRTANDDLSTQPAINTATYYGTGTNNAETSTLEPANVTGPQTVASTSGRNDSQVPAKNVAAVATSPQGWQIFGIAWFLWLLVLAIIFTAWRWIMTTLKNRS